MSKGMYSDVATYMFLMVKHYPYNKLFCMNLKLTVLSQYLLWKEHRYSDVYPYLREPPRSGEEASMQSGKDVSITKTRYIQFL